MALALTVGGTACTSTRPGEAAVPDYALDAYRQGAAEAAQETAAGKPTIYTFGFDRRGGIDPATGLMWQSVAGDAVAPDVLWRIRGHNDAIRTSRGLPPEPPP